MKDPVLPAGIHLETLKLAGKGHCPWSSSGLSLERELCKWIPCVTQKLIYRYASGNLVLNTGSTHRVLPREADNTSGENTKLDALRCFLDATWIRYDFGWYSGIWIKRLNRFPILRNLTFPWKVHCCELTSIWRPRSKWNGTLFCGNKTNQ